MMCDAPELWNNVVKIHHKCVKVKSKLFSLEEMAVRLRSERKLKGLNQADFGALGGVGLQTQSRYEKGETEPGAGYLAQLADAGVDVRFILTGQRSSDSLDPEVAAAAQSLSAMVPSVRAQFLNLLSAMSDQPAFPKSYFRFHF